MNTSSRTAIVVITSVIGGLLLLGLVLALVFGSVFNRTPSDQTLTASIDGVESIDVTMSAGDMEIEFDDVPEAILEVTDGRGAWDMSQRGDTLVVKSPRSPWFNTCFGWCGPQLVTLTLPEELQELPDFHGDLTLSAGSLLTEGDFASVKANVSAGEMTLDVGAGSFESEVSAGELNGTLRDVTSGSFRVSAGSTDLALEGQAPSDVTVRVSAGSADLRLPDAEYRVSSNVSAGELVNDLRTSSSSPHLIDVRVSAGGVTLR